MCTDIILYMHLNGKRASKNVVKKPIANRTLDYRHLQRMLTYYTIVYGHGPLRISRHLVHVTKRVLTLSAFI